MPEIAAAIRKFEADFPLTPPSWLHVRNPARALVLSYGIDQQNGLAPLYLRIHRQQRTMNAHRICLGNVAERPVIRSAPVNTHRNGQRQPLTSSLRPKFLLREDPPLAIYLTDLTLILGFNASNGTRDQTARISHSHSDAGMPFLQWWQQS